MANAVKADKATWGVGGFDGNLTQEHIEEKLEPAWRSWGVLKQDMKLTDIHVEKRVSFGMYLPGVYGTADVIASSGENVLVVADWKFGAQPVMAAGNEQLLFYAAAARRSKPRWGETVACTMVIVQPPFMDTHTASRNSVCDFEESLAAAYRQALGGSHRLHVGDHCQWCPVKSSCIAIRTTVSEVVQHGDFSSLTPDQMSFFLKQIPVVRTWATGVQDYALDYLEKGGVIPGFKVVKKRGRRVWVDDEAAMRALLDAGAAPEQIMHLKSVSQVEKAASVDPTLYEMRSNGNTIADDNDKRQALGMNVLSEALSHARES
jgi:hypothetical protein